MDRYDLLHPQGLLSRDAPSYFSDILRLEDLVKNGIVREAMEQKGDWQLKQFEQDCALIDGINASDDVKQMMKTYRFLKNCNREMTPKREKFLRKQLTAEAFGQLHETLKGLPVTYMYFANKSPEELWQKTAKRFGFDGEDCVNLRLEDQQQRAVEDYLGIHGFPTFLLIGPDGTIVTDKAPRPSQSETVREAIQKLIEK